MLKNHQIYLVKLLHKFQMIKNQPKFQMRRKMASKLHYLELKLVKMTRRNLHCFLKIIKIKAMKKIKNNFLGNNKINK